MPAFEYTGQLPQGTAITGTLEAENIEEARRHLADLTIHISALTQTKQIKSRRALSREDLLFFNRQLASLAENRIALDEGLRAVAKDLERGPLKATIHQLAEDLEQGMPLDQAVARQSGRFPPLYENVLKAGAENNQLGETLMNLNSHLGLVETTRRTIAETVTYPLIVLTTLLAITSFFMFAIVPGFEELIMDIVNSQDFSYVSPDSTLPDPTRFILWLSHVWATVLMVIGGVALLVGTICIASRWSMTLRRIRSKLAVLIPGLSSAYRASLIARFTKAAALGARAGQPLPALVRSAAGATGNELLIQDAERLAANVEAGGPAEQSAKQTRLIPGMVTYTIQVAGARGELAEALADLAHNYEVNARHKMTMVRVLLGPMVIILIAGFVAFAAISLTLPITEYLDWLF